MKKHNIIFLLGLVFLSPLAVVNTSCSDVLEEKPKSAIGPDQLGDSDEAISLWVSGVYNKWCDDMFRWDNFPRVLELDNDYVSGPDWAFSNLGAGNFQGDDQTNTMWTGGYSIINRCNLAIKQIKAMSKCTEDFQNNALGEIYFQKAFVYFMLTRAYGEIPLFDKTVNDGAAYNQPRQSIPDVYTEIIRLLEDAKDLMYTKDESRFELGHVSAGAAAGLLAKVYATMGSGALGSGTEIVVKTGAAYTLDNEGNKVLTYPSSKTFTKDVVAGYENFDAIDCYTKAAAYAKAVMDGDYGHYELMDFDALWDRNNYNTGEHMFMINAKSGDEKLGNRIHRWFCGTPNAAGVIQTGLWIGQRQHWYFLFDHDDYRINQGIIHKYQYYYQEEGNNACYYPKTPEYTLKATGYDTNGQYVQAPEAPYDDGHVYIYNVDATGLAFTTKFADVTDPTLDRTDAYYPMLRYSDIVLIYAEAMAEISSGVSSEAIKALNTLRVRNNSVLAVTSGDNAITTKVALRSTILEERAKELAFEGNRRWDLIRWGIYLQVMNSITGGYDECGVNKSRTARNLLYPLPNSEVQTNDAISENNPGWN
ncbi:MAG TPA: RagB/SusD family nutrient uptake outer membrane protein [Bacteroidaceae bacterium]|nr:RagB/SusD family nutrient uptake outer membrane protein [Bacteroidaceae bacterium]